MRAAESSTRARLFVSRFWVGFGGPHGTIIEPAQLPATDEPTAPTTTQRSAPPAAADAPALRADAERAVWAALDSGAPVVQVVGERGAGTTALLTCLAAQAVRHGYADGGIVMCGVRGPALDVGQRLAAIAGPSLTRRYYDAAALRRRLSGRRAVVVFDRPQLSPAEYAELQTLAPGLQFVVGGATGASPLGPAVVLGPLADAAALALVEAAFGSSLSGAERTAAGRLAVAAGALPGSARMIGAAARVMRRSFAAMAERTAEQLACDLIASLPPSEQRVLGVLALAPALLNANGLTAVVGLGDVRTSLAHLSGCGLIHASDDRYELPRGVDVLVPELSDAAAVAERVVTTVCADLDDYAGGSMERATAAEALIATAFERSEWQTVLEAGPRAARLCGAHGAFGAWGRVLNLIAAAAKRVDAAAALSCARHELGVRSVLLGEVHKATMFLRSAAHDRQSAGDLAGAAASAEILALVEGEKRATAAPAMVAAANVPAGEMGGIRRALTRPMPLIALALTVAAILCVTLWVRPGPPAIADFTPHHAQLDGTRTTQLCVRATNATRLEIAPDVGLLPADGEHCIEVAPAATTTYTAIATGSGGGEARRSITVALQAAPVPQPPPLRIDLFSASPARLHIGDSTQLCYAASGAELLRIVPSIGRLAQYRACRTVTPSEPGSRTYKIVAIGPNGAVLVRHTRIDVVAAPARTPIPPAPPAPSAEHRVAPPDDQLARRAVYQFDATPRVIERGQTASLCVGVGHWARGFLTDIGALPPGLTRCYRVHPTTTRAYRLHVSIDGSKAVETLVIGVRGPSHAHAVAREAQ